MREISEEEINLCISNGGSLATLLEGSFYLCKINTDEVGQNYCPYLDIRYTRGNAKEGHCVCGLKNPLADFNPRL